MKMFGVPKDGTTDMFCNNEAMYNNASTPELKLHKNHHSRSYHMAQESVTSIESRIAKEDAPKQLADLFTKLLTRPRREYIINKFTY